MKSYYKVPCFVFSWLKVLDVADPKMAGQHGSCTIILSKSQWQAKIDEAKTRRKIVWRHRNSCNFSFSSSNFVLNGS